LSLRSLIGRFGVAAVAAAAFAACSGGGGTTSTVPSNGPPASGTVTVGVVVGGPTPTPSPSPAATPFPTGTSVPMPLSANSSQTFATGGAGYSLRVDFGSGVPAGETLYYHGGQPLGWFMASSFIDGVVFSVGPNAVPVSAISGLTQTLGKADPPGTTYGASLSDLPAENRIPLPLAIAPSTTFQTSGTTAGTPITALAPGTVYFIAVGSN